MTSQKPEPTPPADSRLLGTTTRPMTQRLRWLCLYLLVAGPLLLVDTYVPRRQSAPWLLGYNLLNLGFFAYVLFKWFRQVPATAGREIRRTALGFAAPMALGYLLFWLNTTTGHPVRDAVVSLLCIAATTTLWSNLCWAPVPVENLADLPPLPERQPEQPVAPPSYGWGTPELKEITLALSTYAAILYLLNSAYLLRELPLNIIPQILGLNLLLAAPFFCVMVQHQWQIQPSARRTLAFTLGFGFCYFTINALSLLNNKDIAASPFLWILFVAASFFAGAFGRIAVTWKREEMLRETIKTRGPLWGPLFPKHYQPQNRSADATASSDEGRTP